MVWHDFLWGLSHDYLRFHFCESSTLDTQSLTHNSPNLVQTQFKIWKDDFSIRSGSPSRGRIWAIRPWFDVEPANFLSIVYHQGLCRESGKVVGKQKAVWVFSTIKPASSFSSVRPPSLVKAADRREGRLGEPRESFLRIAPCGCAEEAAFGDGTTPAPNFGGRV